MPTPPRIPLLSAAVTGLLSVAAALGVGHLIAGLLLSPAASPFFAVGNAAIDRTPAAVKDFAIRTFATNDKPALLIGMAVALALIGMAVGLFSRRSAVPGLVAIAVIGVVGALAVHEQATGGLALLAPAASLVAGLGVFWWLHRRALPTVAEADAPAEAPPGSSAVGRRPFVVGSLAAAVGAVAAGAGGFALARRVDVGESRQAVGELVPTTPAPPIPAGAAFPELGTPTFITPAADFYRIDINLEVPQLRAQDATLRITGLVDEPLELSFDEIRSMPLVEKTITMTCVSNEVGGPYVSTGNFIGVPLMEVLDRAGIKSDAQQVVGHSADGFTLGTPLDMLRASKDAMLVVGMNREALLPEHGFPLRTVVPGLYGYVSATKWLTELELATYDVKPYWVERGWDGQPPGVVPIKISSRIDAPKSFQQVPGGPGGEVTIAGTAWAQGRGISRVEVRFDKQDWQQAELATEVNANTWRMFRLTTPLPAGQHTVTCRAVDGQGVMQAEERLRLINPGPVPDGSTGWHSILFTAT